MPLVALKSLTLLSHMLGSYQVGDLLDHSFDKSGTKSSLPLKYTLALLVGIPAFIFEHPLHKSVQDFFWLDPIVALINLGSIGYCFYKRHQTIQNKTLSKAIGFGFLAIFISLKALDYPGIPKDDFPSRFEQNSGVGFYVYHGLVGILVHVVLYILKNSPDQSSEKSD